jgi:hypothetical protein
VPVNPVTATRVAGVYSHVSVDVSKMVLVTMTEDHTKTLVIADPDYARNVARRDTTAQQSRPPCGAPTDDRPASATDTAYPDFDDTSWLT